MFNIDGTYWIVVGHFENPMLTCLIHKGNEEDESKQIIVWA